MGPVHRLLVAASALAIAGGCTSGPVPEMPQDPAGALELARRLLQEAPDQALALLGELDEDALTPEETEAYKYLYAESMFLTGDAWDAFKVIRTFVEDHRFSDWSPFVEDLQFRIGATLIQSPASYFLFGSDRDDGELVLQEFVERYPTSPHLPDALRLLGELAFEEERWFDSQRRFEQLIQDHPESEWLALASFRRVMALHAELLGPEYDFPSLSQTRNELRDYLATEPERPEFRAAAGAALAEVEDWVAQRHMLDADFYRTVGNRYGERFHLRVLLEDSPAHPLAQEARQRLAELEGGS